MAETDPYAESLRVTDPLQEPIFRSAIQALQFPLGSRGLDVGCGIGLQAMLLAEAAGPAGHVTGLDLSPSLLLVAGDLVERAGLAESPAFILNHPDYYAFFTYSMFSGKVP